MQCTSFACVFPASRNIVRVPWSLSLMQEGFGNWNKQMKMGIQFFHHSLGEGGFTHDVLENHEPVKQSEKDTFLGAKWTESLQRILCLPRKIPTWSNWRPNLQLLLCRIQGDELVRKEHRPQNNIGWLSNLSAFSAGAEAVGDSASFLYNFEDFSDLEYSTSLIQITYANQQPQPEFRRVLWGTKYYAIPFNFPWYTAYTEVSLANGQLILFACTGNEVSSQGDCSRFAIRRDVRKLPWPCRSQ